MPNILMPAAKVSHYDHGQISHEEKTENEKSEYQSIIYNLHHHPKWIKEVNTGRRVGFYRFRGDLGQGNFSTVKLAQHQLTKDKVAVKVIEKSKLDQKTQRMLTREINNMDIIAHPNIIRMFEVVETLSRIHLVLEFAPGGELFNKVTTEGKLAECDAASFFNQVLSAVTYLHSISVIHRDIKAENVFLAGRKKVKLGDFGFSTRVTNLEEQLATFCGSPPYAAPELYKDESYKGPAVDVWAMGILLFFLLTADMPFKASTVAGLKRQILGGSFLIPSHVSENARDIINKIVVQDPKDRLTPDAISNHPWLSEACHLKEALPSHVIYPRINGPLESLTNEETKVLECLDNWGITREALENQGATTGARSSLVATYRICMHRLLNEAEQGMDLLKEPGSLQEEDSLTGAFTPESESLGGSRCVTPKKHRLRLKNEFARPKKIKSKACQIL